MSDHVASCNAVSLTEERGADMRRRLCLDPATLGFDVELKEYVDAIGQAGFVQSEWSIDLIEHLPQRDRSQKVAALFEKAGVAPSQFTCGLGVPPNVAVAESAYVENLAKFVGYCRFARGINCHRASLFVDSTAHGGVPVSDAVLRRRLREIDAVASEEGIDLAVSLVDRDLLTRASELLVGSQLQCTGLLVDTVTLGRAGLDGSWVRELPHGLINWLRIADAGVSGASATGDHGVRVFPGDGDLPLPDVIAACIGNGYSGAISLELSPDLLRGYEPAARARLAYEAMCAYFRC